VLLDLCAHVAAYEAVLKRWEEDDYTEHAVSLWHPGEALRKYAEGGFSQLKVEQQGLLRAEFEALARADRA
jgi:hypothetical protein